MAVSAALNLFAQSQNARFHSRWFFAKRRLSNKYFAFFALAKKCVFSMRIACASFRFAREQEKRHLSEKFLSSLLTLRGVIDTSIRQNFYARILL